MITVKRYKIEKLKGKEIISGKILNEYVVNR